MSIPVDDQTQAMIDSLFDKLDRATTGGELSQLQHALRIQISRKKNAGGTLSGRERGLIAAVGDITGRRSSALRWLVTLAIVLGLLAYLYQRFIAHGS